jgi:D-aspartate ligase
MGMVVDRQKNDHTGLAAPRRAIVLGGYYGALAVARALSKEGVRVMLVTPHRRDHACGSRFVSELVLAPEPPDAGEELLSVLMEADQAWTGALLVPTMDMYATFVSRNQVELRRRFVFAVPGPEVLDQIIYKNVHYAAAKEAGVPVPDFLVPESISSLDEWRNASRYPCILKPYEHERFLEVYDAKVLVAHDFQELTRLFADTQDKGLDVMVCEIIPGDDSSIFIYHSYIDSRGEVLAEMCTQKLRQYPVGFGQGSVVRTVPLVPEIREYALRLLAAAGYRGESSAEFRLDHRDGQYKLMEINVRPVQYEWLLVAAGVNSPYITYLDLVEDVRVAHKAYDEDLCWINNHWEPVNLVRFLREGEGGLRAFSKPYGKRRVYAVPFWDDPVHFLRELWRYAGVALKRMREAARRTPSPAVRR